MKRKRRNASASGILILFEDESLLVINKPAGLVVNKAESVKGKTIQGWMEKKLRAISHELRAINDFYKRAGVVHRLDKETSGVMVLAKNEETFVALQKQFKKRTVKKIYLALVHGSLKAKASDIKAPVKRSAFDRRRFMVSIKGREAVTYYKTLKVFQKEGGVFSYLKVRPKTGRTHQIRVHFKHLGFPLVSDPLYLGKKTLRRDRQWCPRLFLHAAQIKFFHPENQQRLSFKASLPDDLQKALKTLA